MFVLPTPRPLGALADELGGLLDPGLAPHTITALCPPQLDHDASALVPLLRPRWLPEALSARGVLLVDPALGARLPEGRRWLHPQPSWVLASLLGPDDLPDDERSLALIEPGARVAPSARIGAHAIVRRGAVVADGVIVEAGALILGGVELRQGARVGARSVLGRAGFGWAQGPDGQLRRMPHRGGVVVEEDAEIGALCTIDAGVLTPTLIGRGARLDSHVHVGHNVVIGAGTLVAAQSGFAGSAQIGRGVRVGGQAGITDHARIGDGAQIAAKAGVIGDVPSGTVVAGYPAIERIRWLRAQARLLAVDPRRPRRDPP